MKLSIERSALIQKARKRIGQKCTPAQLAFRCNIEALNWRDMWINEKAGYLHKRLGDVCLLALSDAVLTRVRLADSEYYHSLINGDFSDDTEFAYAIAHAIAVECWYKMRNRIGSLVDFEVDEVAAWLDARLMPSQLRLFSVAEVI